MMPPATDAHKSSATVIPRPPSDSPRDGVPDITGYRFTLRGNSAADSRANYPDSGTDILNETETLDYSQTGKLAAETAPLSEETVQLGQGEETSPLYTPTAAADSETALLAPSG